MSVLYLKDDKGRVEVETYVESGQLYLKHYVADEIPFTIQVLDVKNKMAFKEHMYRVLKTYQQYRNNFYSCSNRYFMRKISGYGMTIYNDGHDDGKVLTTTIENPKLEFYNQDNEPLKSKEDIDRIINYLVDNMD